jgi:hypothetical protein
MGISWRFCLVLACSVVVSRPSATIRTGSLDSGWWGTEAAKQLLRAARQQIVQGNYAAAERIFADGAAEAKHRGDRISAARLLSGVGAARLARFDFQGVLEANIEAKHTAESAGDWLNVGAIDLNLASLYEQVWDLDAALRAAEEGRAALNRSTAYYKGPLLLEIARLHAERRDLDPIGILFEAVEAAHSEQEPAIEARAWSQIGSTRITRGDLSGAEDAFVQAYYLRRMFMPRDLGLSYSELGALRLLNVRVSSDDVVRSRLLDQAENFTALAATEDRRGAVSIPGYELQQQRGRIRLLRGDMPGALSELSAAMESAGRWRPGMASAELQAQSMEQFIEAAADYVIQTRNPKWIAASFLAEETTRGSNLKDNASLIEAWRRKLPARFWSTLAELRAEEDRLRRAGISHGPQSDRLRLELISMEAQAGFGLKPEKNREIFSPERSLIHYQRVLGNSAVLLSFALGEKRSFLWALTGSTLNLYRLPARKSRVWCGNSVRICRRDALKRNRLPGSYTPCFLINSHRLKRA